MVGTQQAAVDQATESIAKAFGIDLEPRRAVGAYVSLTPTQIGAVTAALEAAVELAVRGASGSPPEFAAMETAMLAKLQAAGWWSGYIARNRSAELLALRQAASQSDPWSLLGTNKRDALKTWHDKKTADILAAASAEPADSEPVKISENFLRHPDCGESMVHLYWRDRGRRMYTDFELHVFLDAPFVGAAREAMYSETIWRAFKWNYRSEPGYFGASVTGFVPRGGRDGLAASFDGFIPGGSTPAAAQAAEIAFAPASISVRLDERML